MIVSRLIPELLLLTLELEVTRVLEVEPVISLLATELSDISIDVFLMQESLGMEMYCWLRDCLLRFEKLTG